MTEEWSFWFLVFLAICFAYELIKDFRK